MTEYRKVEIDVPVGNWFEIQSSGQVKVGMNLDRMNSETATWVFRKGLTLAIRNAYASAKTTEERQARANAKARDICQNVRQSGSNSQWTQLESAMIRTLVTIAHNGTMPQGGMATVWQEIEGMPSDKRDRLRTVAQSAIDLQI